MIKVSVVIPVYGVEDYLKQCLDSVLMQTMEDIEVICIDDASPDRCPEILDEYAARHPRIRVFHLEKNRKQGYGRNLGLREAKGKYVYFLDADDMIVPGAMQILYDTAENEDLEGIMFDAEALYENDELRRRFSGSFVGTRQGAYPSEACDGQALAEIMLENHEWNVLVQRQFWRRAYLIEKSICFPENTEHEDQYFTIAAVLAARRIRYIPQALFVRRFRDNSVVTSPAAPKNFHGYLINILQLLRFMRRENIAGHAADVLIMLLIRNLNRLYPVFEQDADPKEWFKDQETATLYSFYQYEQKTRELERQYDKKIFSSLDSDKTVWIYGCGQIGRRLYQRLVMLGFYIEGFIVTDPTGNPNEAFGHKVISLDEYQPAEREIVIVAISGKHHEEVSCSLSQRSIEHYLYANDVISGPYGEA